MVNVRPARPPDIPAIVRCWRGLMAVHEPLEPALYALADNAEATYAAFIRRKIDDGRSVTLVAPATGPVEGYLVGGVGLRSPVYKVREVGMVFDLAVNEGARRRGLGRALVIAADERFREMGLTRVQVNYAPDNAQAAAFWPAVGYVTFLIEAYRSLGGGDQPEAASKTASKRSS